jgi:hypothetical protein
MKFHLFQEFRLIDKAELAPLGDLIEPIMLGWNGGAVINIEPVKRSPCSDSRCRTDEAKCQESFPS